MNRFTNQTNRLLIKLTLLAILLAASSGAASAQTSAFTYQGRLTDASAAATGAYDFQFALFDAATAGTQIGAIGSVPAVSVTNGTFTVSLDFGAAAFAAGADRFLEIRLKRAAETAYTVLTPRQRVTAAPYAVRAAAADTADTATNAQQLGGSAATNYLQRDGSAASLTNLNASSITGGTLPDAALSANVARRDTANTFTGDQTINGNLVQTGTFTDLNLTNGFVARGTLGTGAIPATGAGSRMMFYPGKAAFRAGRVFVEQNEFGGIRDGSSYWDDENIGTGSVAFGSNNRASGENSTALGFFSSASGLNATAMGSSSEAAGEESLALGPAARAIGLASTAIGVSTARGIFSVAIGYQNNAAGDFSIAIGKNARTCATTNCFASDAKRGAIVISDACATFVDDAVYASANNQVNIRGCGGFRFFTGQNTGIGSSDRSIVSGVSLAPGGSQWLSLSDRNSKENFASVNARDVLRKVLHLPITTWNYKSQDASIRHIGAMAQDFKAAFEIGEDDKHISALDPDGVAFAAIQGLNEELNEQTAKLKTENARLNAQVAAQQTQLNQLKQAVCALAPDAAGCGK